MNYLLRNIPASLWAAAKHRTVDRGITLRKLLFLALQDYLKR